MNEFVMRVGPIIAFIASSVFAGVGVRNIYVQHKKGLWLRGVGVNIAMILMGVGSIISFFGITSMKMDLALMSQGGRGLGFEWIEGGFMWWVIGIIQMFLGELEEKLIAYITCNTKIQAKVTRIDEKLGGKGKKWYAPVFSFTYNGKDYVDVKGCHCSLSRSLDFEVGQTYEICIYDNNPNLTYYKRCIHIGDVILPAIIILVIVLQFNN